jgi:hypothetical protein
MEVGPKRENIDRFIGLMVVLYNDLVLELLLAVAVRTINLYIGFEKLCDLSAK